MASALTLVCALYPAHWLAQAVALIGFVLLPGFVFGFPVLRHLNRWAERLPLAAGFGATVLMVEGFAASKIGNLVGVDRPLDRVPQLVLFAAFAAVACGIERWQARDFLPEIVPPATLRSLLPLGMLLLPAAACAGAVRLNHGNGNELALAVLTATWLVIVALLLWVSLRPHRLGSGVLLSLFSAVLSLVWATSLRGEHLFGWDIQREFSAAQFISKNGSWVLAENGNAYRSMLSITAFPAQLHSVSGLPIETILRVVFPVFLVGIVIALISALHRFTSARSALVATTIFVVAGRAFPQQMPAIARQELALFLFVCALLVLACREIPTWARRGGVAALFAAISFTHYTTAYATAALVVGAWLLSLLTQRERAVRRHESVLTLPVVALILLVTFGWNMGVTKNGAMFDRPASTIEAKGLQLLPGEKKGLAERWLQGSGMRRVTVEEYEAEVAEVADLDLSWLHPDNRLANTKVVDDVAPAISGPLAGQQSMLNLAVTVLGQVLLLLVTLGTVRLLLKRRWQRHGLPPELLGLLVGASLMSLLLRVSGSAAMFYNPERAALHSGLLFAFAIAVLSEHAGRTRHALRLLLLGAAALFSFNMSGLAPQVFAGAPTAAVSASGENVERFVVFESEIATARWLEENLGDRTLVQTDRYGQVRLLNVADREKFGVLDIMLPHYIDHNAWLFASHANVIEERARGQRNGKIAVFSSPAEDIAEIRSTLYATEDTRVYR